MYRTLYEINVTNLVDVVLVLLIVFMISAPLLQSGVKVELPKTTYVDADIEEGIVVTMQDKDSLGIYIGTGQTDDYFTGPVRFEETLNEYLNRLGRNQPVYLRADKSVRWEYVVDIIAKIKRQGVTNLGLVTQHLEFCLVVYGSVTQYYFAFSHFFNVHDRQYYP
jgi:biopolymer transport protein TolR